MFLIDSLVGTLKKSVTFKGRATKKDFWIFILFWFVVNIVLSLVLLAFSLIAPPLIFGVLLLLINIVLLVPYISVAVRRLHDLNLSGFWLWYLNPVGLPVIFLVYLLDLDKASNLVIDKIQKIGSPWLGWILTFIFWPLAAGLTLFLLFLYDGKKADNDFGPNPYV